jgi:predicted nucleic acid-binding protein
VIVVDATVWVSRFMPRDEFHERSRRWLSAHTAAGGRVVAPLLLQVELAGAVSRRTGDPALARRAGDSLLRLSSLRLVPLDPQLGRAAADVAANLGLRGADAVYVATARALHVPLLTWDDDQRERAGRVIAAYSPGTHDRHILWVTGAASAADSPPAR